MQRKNKGRCHAISIHEYRQSLWAQDVYAKDLRRYIPKNYFKPVPRRILWLPFHYLLIFLFIFCVLKINNTLLNILFSVLAGHSMGCLFFVGHELVHGAVLKNKTMIYWFAAFCFLPWGLHPAAWTNAHNRMHHQHTQSTTKDPDCWGKGKYRHNKIVRRLHDFLPGSGSVKSYTFLFWFFTFYSIYINWFARHIFKKDRQQLVSKLFFITVHTIWIFTAAAFHKWGFFFFFLIPAAVANFVVMSYIATNHFLNPLTEDTNDPLINSLSVSTGKFWNFWHLNFSYHTEHHIFPYMSPEYAPFVSRLLCEKYPDKYNRMSHLRALRLLYSKPKFYADELTLEHPVTKIKSPTLLVDEMLSDF